VKLPHTAYGTILQTNNNYKDSVVQDSCINSAIRSVACTHLVRETVPISSSFTNETAVETSNQVGWPHQ
jgi:hypothetical protein